MSILSSKWIKADDSWATIALIPTGASFTQNSVWDLLPTCNFKLFTLVLYCNILLSFEIPLETGFPFGLIPHAVIFCWLIKAILDSSMEHWPVIVILWSVGHKTHVQILHAVKRGRNQCLLFHVGRSSKQSQPLCNTAEWVLTARSNKVGLLSTIVAKQN